MINQSKLAVNDLHYTKGHIFKILMGISTLTIAELMMSHTHIHTTPMHA